MEGPQDPVARLTPLGWTCVGGPNTIGQNEPRVNFASTFFGIDTLDMQVQRFWELEEMMDRGAEFSTDEKRILKESKESMTRVNQRYEVKIPWKGEVTDCSINRIMARNRLISLEKKLMKDQDLDSEYRSVIESHISRNYIREVPDIIAEPCGWLLPHFPIIRREKATTKVRIVFDAAAKCSKNCLNDFIQTGPKLQNDLVEILIRFRKNTIALVSDISEMYLQIGVQQDDRRNPRFLWRNNDKIENTDSLEFKGVSRKAVIYGKKGKQNRTVQKGTFPQLGQTLSVKEILNLMKSVKVGRQSKSCVLKSLDWECVGVRGCSQRHSRKLDNRVWHRWMEKKSGESLNLDEK